MNGRRLVGDFKVVVRSYLRNPVALFFSLIFPIILIALFGAILGGNGTISTPLAVENLDHNSPPSQAFLAALNNTTLVQVTLVNLSGQDFGAALGNNGYTSGLIIPAGFGANYTNDTAVNVQLYTNPQDASGPASRSAPSRAWSPTSTSTRPAAPALPCSGSRPGTSAASSTRRSTTSSPASSASRSSRARCSRWSTSPPPTGRRIFRELSLTPLTKAEWLTSRILWYVLLTFVSAGIMIGAGVALFNAHVEVNAGLLPFLFAGPFLFVSLGMLAGTVARTPESAALMGNIITFPMMFLSGTFFAVSLFPAWLQPIAHVLPLYYVIDGMNQVMLFSNDGRALMDLVIVIAIALVFFLLAIRLFTWRDA